MGREVAKVVNEKKSPGYYEVEFNAGDLPSGIYFYRLSTPKFSLSKKMTLIK
ncbi:MAG: hypothetical protein IPM14_16985 [bacterium]|nr:hypothetical protein [bacterium]